MFLVLLIVLLLLFKRTIPPLFSASHQVNSQHDHWCKIQSTKKINSGWAWPLGSAVPCTSAIGTHAGQWTQPASHMRDSLRFEMLLTVLYCSRIDLASLSLWDFDIPRKSCCCESSCYHVQWWSLFACLVRHLWGDLLLGFICKIGAILLFLELVTYAWQVVGVFIKK